MMVPENDGTINSLLDHLQSLSDATWPVKDEVDAIFTEPIASHSSEETAAQSSSQLNEDWREVYTYSRFFKIFFLVTEENAVIYLFSYNLKVWFMIAVVLLYHVCASKDKLQCSFG